MSDWHQTRTGRLMWWLENDAPDWIPDRTIDPAITASCRFHCWVHGHAVWMEMDGRSIVCAHCHTLQGERVKGETPTEAVARVQSLLDAVSVLGQDTQ